MGKSCKVSPLYLSYGHDAEIYIRRITPWVTNMGYQNAFLVGAFVSMAQILVFLIFIKWGRSMRKGTATRYKRYVMELEADGLKH